MSPPYLGIFTDSLPCNVRCISLNVVALSRVQVIDRSPGEEFSDQLLSLDDMAPVSVFNQQSNLNAYYESLVGYARK